MSFQVNSVNCNTSWKIVLFMKWSDNQEIVLKGVRLEAERCIKWVFFSRSFYIFEQDLTGSLLLSRGTSCGYFTQNRRSSSHVTITEKSSTSSCALPDVSLQRRPPAAKRSGKWRWGRILLAVGWMFTGWASQHIGFSHRTVTDPCCDIRWCSTIRVEGAPATGTACSGSNTWPLGTTWLQRSVDFTMWI